MKKAGRYSAKGRAFVHAKIPALVAEGYPQDQAVAVAHSMARKKGLRVPRGRGKSNPFFAPEAIQYVARFSGLANPPAGRALFEADSEVLFNPDESLQRLERLVEQDPNDLGLSIKLLRARHRAGMPLSAEANRVAAMAREPGVDSDVRMQVLQAVAETTTEDGMFFADVVESVLGRDRHDPLYPPDGFGRAKCAEVFRAVLKDLGAGLKDVSLKTPDYSMADSISVSIKTPKGRQALEELFLFMEAGGSGGPPSAITGYLYPSHREDTSVSQADYHHPGGPVIRSRHVMAVAKKILLVAFKGGAAAGKLEGHDRTFQIGEVVRRTDTKGLAAKKRWIVSGFTYDDANRRQHQLTAMSGGVKGSEIERMPGHALKLDEDQSKQFDGPHAWNLRRSHEHRVQLHNQFHPNGYYKNDPRRLGGISKPPEPPIESYGVQLWADEGGTQARTAATRHSAFVEALRKIGVHPTQSLTPGVLHLGHVDPADVWAALIDAGFEGLEPPEGEDDTRIYMKNPGDRFSCAVCMKQFGHGRALYDPISRTWYHQKCVSAGALPAGRQLYRRDPDPEGLEKFADVDDKIRAKHAGGALQNPFFAPEAIQYVARFSGLANPPRSNPKGPYPFAAKQEQYSQYPIHWLEYAMKDAAEARDAMRGHDPDSENYYADDVHTISDELRRRRKPDSDAHAAAAKRAGRARKGASNPGERRCAACLIRLQPEAPAWAPEGMFGACYTCAEKHPALTKRRLAELSAQSGPFVFPKTLPKSLGAEAPASFYGVAPGWPYGHDYRTGPTIGHGR